MQNQQHVRLRWCAFALSALVAGCATSTTVEQEWSARPTQAEGPMQNVATLFVGDKLVVRPAAELQLAQQLQSKGIRATPAYTVLGDIDTSNLDAVKDKLKANGF